MPCLNEAETLEICIKRAAKLLEDNKIDGEIVISDNGSTDGSQEIARRCGARVVNCPVRGYGAALQYGIEQAEGDFILMGDSDDSYHFDESWPMILALRQGYDVCMGTRLKGTIMPGAMPLLNRRLGNPVLTGIGKLLFHTKLSDFHCGMRAFRQKEIIKLNLVTTGMEWASEMVIKSNLAGLKMTEVPITLHKDGRSRPPHLRRWRDGWRHLRFMLLHSPNWLFTLPGALLILAGATGEAVLGHGTVKIGNAVLDVHSLLVMAFLIILGVQILFSGIFANIYTRTVGILPWNEKFDQIIKKLTLEKLLLVSLILGGVGITGVTTCTWHWYAQGFSPLDYQTTMRKLVPSLTLLTIAVQGIFNGFMLSILFLKHGSKNARD
ncbi:glycosyltransferase family 2 protein [Oryzomonas japonica]|uniref:Glycosyltransferase family 2 protein n=2 Tax=Oryzomonas japonica TaxID=2603858 RepID=A0A7J4ZNL3_9BACT|nr:glycosyltransferase family 2 protein [Oryzomonas japonica]